MTERFQTLNTLLTKRELKKAEVLIARWLRGTLPADERARILTLRARVRLLGGRIDEALMCLQQAKALLANDDFDAPDALELLGDCYFARYELASVGFADRADAAQALQTYERILATFPNYANIGWIQYQRGRVLLTENRIEEAIACFQRALLSPSRSPELTAYCYERLGFVAFYEMRDSAGALSFLNKAIDTYPSAAPRLWLVQVHTLRSRVLRETRQHEAALDAAEAAISVAHAAGSEGKIGLADALLTAGETSAEFTGYEQETIAYLTQFLQISRKPLGVDVTWSRVQEMLGDAYSKTGQHQLAVTAYQAALRYNPYHPWEQSLDYRIARSYYQLGEYKKAIAQIDKLIRATEADGQIITDYRVFNVLGSALFALGQYPRAMQAYQNAIDIAPPSVNVTRIHEYYQFAREQTRPA